MGKRHEDSLCEELSVPDDMMGGKSFKQNIMGDTFITLYQSSKTKRVYSP